MPTKRALIVDDSTTAQYRLKKMLRVYDLQIDAVDSGEAALLHLASNVPDVIFMDHLMPGMDGFRALQIIKSHPETAMIPVIMYTSKSGDVYTGQARALGALDVISKDTINSADLSKVMNGIHIFHRDDQAAAQDAADGESDGRNFGGSDGTPTPTSTAQERAPLDFSDLPKAEPVAARVESSSADNSRRIELRISQLEHAIDDSRRVITARLVREIQKLRYNITRELTEHLGAANLQKSTPDTPVNHLPLSPNPESNQVDNRQGGGLLAFATLALVVVVGGLMWNHFTKLNERLTALSEQQAEQRSHLNSISNSILEMQAALESHGSTQAQQGIANSNKVVKASTLNDLVSSFNQRGEMPFSPDVMEPKTVERLTGFVERIGQQGFKGAVWVNLSAGDFCVITDSAGQAQLPAKGTRMSDCILLSELYRIENLLDEAVEEIDDNVTRLGSVNKGDINVIVSRLDDNLLPYPTRQPQMLASDWNKIAQSNNRLSLELSDVDSLQ